MSRYFVDDSYYFITIPTIKHFPFFDTPEKKSLILRGLQKSKDFFQLKEFDYSIMSDHYHCVAYFQHGGVIPKLLKSVNGGSASLLNKITGNRNPVWDEYYIYLIENEILLDKVRGYVVGNPLKHGDVKTLEELKQYPFSSYRLLIKKLGAETVNEFINSVIELDDKEFLKANLTDRPTRLKSV